ncbi:hypothetical protein [Methanolobus sp. WCC5]|uniref:hypothetical protein n=1 Tax=Methanolobus sp. WCC5 TaxID=3125785 RepID=UPI003255FF8E
MPELDKEEQKAFIEELMAENELKGASKKRLIKFLGEQYGWDRQRVQFKLKRAILAEKYAQSH